VVTRVGFALVVLTGCAEERVCVRPDRPWVELSTVEAGPACQPLEAVEMQSGEHDPSSHELLRAYAADRGANYVVLDAFGAIKTDDDILAITRARLFRCPIALTSYFHLQK